MEKNPADRYATAQELADDMRLFLEDKPVRAKQQKLVQRARKWARRHTAVVWSAAVCFMLSTARAHDRWSGPRAWLPPPPAACGHRRPVGLLEVLGVSFRSRLPCRFSTCPRYSLLGADFDLHNLNLSR